MDNVQENIIYKYVWMPESHSSATAHLPQIIKRTGQYQIEQLDFKTQDTNTKKIFFS